MPRREYESIADAAARLAVHERTIRRMIERGEIKGYRVGSALRVDPAEVDDAVSPDTTAVRSTA
jgi:excisionase family DNA binding protein